MQNNNNNNDIGITIAMIVGFIAGIIIGQDDKISKPAKKVYAKIKAIVD